jgi:galactofuranosylgalactofuranosylrhamnosyl-N-acetylglucosaminyl-diphospho-decaprenol beta-1,5/1,6-galactofuranosyltransferase
VHRNSTRKFKLQNLILPHLGRVDEHWTLFYRGQKMIFDSVTSCYHIRNEQVDFATYFNGFSNQKWNEYTNIDNVSLELTLKGHITINLVGYDLFHRSNPVRNVIKRESFSLDEKNKICLEFPTNKHMLLSFEIEVISGSCELYEGSYYTEIDESLIKNVNLSLVTVTFNKEEFIIPNIKLIKEQIIQGNDEIAKSFDLFVIDNGRTLDVNALTEEHIHVIPNKNVGGAGGFTRGMIEAKSGSLNPSHILLMDDDVEVLPESLVRTYNLLSLLNEEYKDAFISGAMLFYEEMNTQHEDIGFCNVEGSYGPVKEKFNHNRLKDILRNSDEWPHGENTYAGWWYCCFPAAIATDDNLPLPLFIRGDDVEFSLRHRPKFITMNSICVWHMGFTFKFNGAMELYQVHRNSLIIKAVSGVLKNVDLIARIKKHYRMEALRFNYDAADFLLDSLEDYLKGPSFIMEDNGESIMKEKFKKNEKLYPLSHFPHVKVDLNSVYHYVERTKKEEILYKLTLNGHLLPKIFLKKETGIVAYNWFYCPQHQYLRREVLAVNPQLRQATIRVLDKKRFFILMKRYRKLMKLYRKNHVEVEQEYTQKKGELTSQKFWESYLEIRNRSVKESSQKNS